MIVKKEEVIEMIQMLKDIVEELENIDSYVRTPVEEKAIEILYDQIDTLEINMEYGYKQMTVITKTHKTTVIKIK